MRIIVWLVGSLFLMSAKAQPQKIQHKKKGSLEKSSFQEILDRYLFIGDFNEKPSERPVSTEVFWRYPFKAPPQTFELDLNKEQIDGMVFRVPGDGRIAEHFAKGRVEFLEGRYDEAHTTWLAGRQQFDKDPLTNRRLEFFLGLNAAQVLRDQWKVRKGNLSDPELKRMINRVSYFLASTFVLRRDVPDPLIDKHAPWGLYNLSVLYYMLDRWNLVAGSTQEGLGALLKQGRKEYRPKFRQMMAEIYIKNMDLLPAIQELDTAIRQDPDPIEAVRMFSRAGDIYFSLNNFELAEDTYNLASRIDETRAHFEPSQALLRGETEFWLGKFSYARQLMTMALNASLSRDKDWLVETKATPWLRLRIADTWLAELAKTTAKDRKKLAEETRLAYFRVESEHPNTEAARIAQVRGACMDLPTYEGNNIKHARELLTDVRTKNDVPEILMELVEACFVGSFSDRERTPEMVEKVRAFSDKYPNSKFLSSMLPAVKDVQATNIEPYFKVGKKFSATEFFEKRRKVLFPKVSKDLAHKLFGAYVDTSRSEKAKEFWPQVKDQKWDEDQLLRAAAFLSEVSGKDKASRGYEKDLKKTIETLETWKWSAEPSTLSREFVTRLANGARAKEHLLWLEKAVRAWSKDDDDVLCTTRYQLASRIFEGRSDAAAKKVVRTTLDEVFPDEWQGLSKDNKSCGQSWLDLESKVYTARDLQKRYDMRGDWTLEGPWLERLWTHSEEIEKNGRHDEAKKIWQKIAKDAPAESFEGRMAKTRLAPPQTEVEGLWR